MTRPVPQGTTQIVTIPFGHCTITVQANGGAVDILMLHDYINDIWVPAASSMNADGAVTLFPGPNAQLKMVVTGSAKWSIQGPGF